MEEYLKVLLEQIRCKKAHPAIREELQSHIENQIAENRSNGMTREEAEEEAIKDMGSAVEAGVSLDRIHRPQMAWQMIVIMAVITIAGMVIHILIGTPRHSLYAVIGFAVMLLIYRLDYTWIARFSKILATAFLVLCIAGLFWIGEVNIALSEFDIGPVQTLMFSFMMLYVPLYGAIVYKYYGTAYRGVIESVIWMICPVIIAVRLSSLYLAMVLLLSMSAVLTIAILNDWFCIARKRVLAVLWGGVLGLPIICLVTLQSYQVARIQAFLKNDRDMNFVTSLVRSYLGDSAIIGGTGKDIHLILPDYDSSFILTYLSSSYGLIVGILVCCVLAFLVIKAFSISFRQKNQLGMIMGCGSSIILLLNISINIAENVGIFPYTQTFLPFFSAGGSGTIVCYIFVGIIMSVYRYKSIYPQHMNTKRPGVKIES